MSLIAFIGMPVMMWFVIKEMIARSWREDAARKLRECEHNWVYFGFEERDAHPLLAGVKRRESKWRCCKCNSWKSYLYDYKA